MHNLDLLSLKSTLDPISFSDIPQHLNFLKQIQNNWSGPPDALIKYIDEFSKTEIAGRNSDMDTLAVYKELITDKVNNFQASGFLESYKIVTLRELFYLSYGVRIAFSPFSQTWLRSEKTILHADNGLRVSLFRCGDIHFVEYDFRGWLGSPNGFIFPFSGANHVLADFLNPTRWGPNPTNNLLIDSIKELYSESKASLKSDIKIASLTESNENLGHFLWNKMSGVLLTVDLFKNTNRKLSLLIPDLGLKKKSQYSDINLSMVSIDMFQTMGLIDQCNIEIINSSDELKSIFLTDGIFSKLNVLSLDKKTIELYCSFYERKISALDTIDISTNSSFKINIFMNIRGHNKSLANVEACVLALIKKLPKDLHNKLFFILEGLSDSIDTISKLSEIFKKNNIADLVIIDANQYQLYFYLKYSSICITPVGSGLVMPTWLFDNKVCIAYADHNHMSQLNWWSNIVPHHPKIIKFQLDEIKHTENRTGHPNIFYSDFEIDSDAFANLVASEILKKAEGCASS